MKDYAARPALYELSQVLKRFMTAEDDEMDQRLALLELTDWQARWARFSPDEDASDE